MLELPHTLVGAAIATKIPNPLLAFIIAFLSHLPLDLVPHWNPRLYTETKKYGRPTRKSTLLVVVDACLALGAGIFLASRFLPDLKRFLTVILACFGSVVLDVIEAPYFFLGFRPQWLKRLILWERRHQGKATKIPGLVIQGVTVALALTIALS